MNFKTPILKGNPLFSQGDYDVFVGAPSEDSFAMYVVVNREYGVVEYTNEVLPLIKEWLNHFVPGEQKAASVARAN